MKYIVLGKQKVDYVSSKTGQRVQGENLHCKYLQKNVEGEAVEKLYISSNVNSPIVNVGDEIDVFYNRYGGVDEVRLV
jgi:hypothetical protein